MKELKRVLSGMQPTGELHIGNYLGALKQWVEMSRDPALETLFCVVDAHAITVDYEPEGMPERVLDAVATYVAGGIDPERSILFVQSDVPEHMELAWYLTSVTAMGDLQRMTQFKEKSEQLRQNATAGLFTYPILMAADILIYKAAMVPVGDDQIQHLELTREIARRFNHRFGRVFPEPQPKLSKTPRIMGLDGKSKMSKSLGNAIGLFDPPKVVEKKLKGAFTDPQKLRRGDPGRPDICNVYTMHTALTPEEELPVIKRDCESGALGCGDCKKRLTETMLAEISPVRERALELRADKSGLVKLLGRGRDRARGIAQETLREVRDRMKMTTATYQ